VNLLQKVHHRVDVLSSLMWQAHTTRPSMEIVYRDLFVRDIAKLGLDDSYYPVGSAANYSLLYFVTRCFLELPIRNAIEFGAGQSSVLMSQLNDRLKKEATITTVEHDTLWANIVRAKVNHAVITADLVPKTIDGHKISHYGGEYFDSSALYDFVLVDGPPAHKKETAFNRLGAVELIENNLADSFVIVLDDMQREGEQELANLIHRTLQKRGGNFGEVSIRGTRPQHAFAGGAFFSAAYF
jgi:predicted O-methyltransferase YrrM